MGGGNPSLYLLIERRKSTDPAPFTKDENMLYKLTKGTLSRIRKTKKEIDELLEQGYTLDGEVNEKYEVVDANPVFDAPKPKTKKQK